MQATARIVGIVWMFAVGLAVIWVGIKELNGMPGLIFKEGYGELYVAFAAALPGYFSWQWGSRHSKEGPDA